MSPRTARIILAMFAAAFVGFLIGVGEILTFLLIVGAVVGSVCLWLALALLVCRALDGDLS